MNDSKDDVFVYLLIDNGLLQEVSASYIETDSKARPAWLMPIYGEHSLSVSPLLIDVEAAYEAGDLDQVMSLLHARAPALHVSIIETTLDLDRIAQHLRRFIFILDPTGKQFTLRYADCAVLASLSCVLSAEQWATMRGPIVRWDIHDRAGAFVQLPPTEFCEGGPTPLCLDHDQLASLDEVSEPDHYVAKVKMMRNNASLPGTPADHHAWAQAARQAWRAADNSNVLILTFLTEAAIVTRGEILDRQDTRNLLAMDEVSTFRIKLRELINELHQYRNDASQTTDFEKSNEGGFFT